VRPNPNTDLTISKVTRAMERTIVRTFIQTIIPHIILSNRFVRFHWVRIRVRVRVRVGVGVTFSVL
jgi:hypothetical protein